MIISKSSIVIYLFIIVLNVNCLRKYDKNDIKYLREEVREMFQHAYDGYLKYASNYDELRPLSCDGINTWGSYSLTLIDALDTLAVMGNYTEFNRVVSLLINTINFDTDINVSVFETNIRIVGGLLSAHLLSLQAGADLEPGWPCNGPLLRLAEDVAKRLLPAFDTKTGMPYGTVNLKYGVPPGETSVTCTAGVGTYIVEFGALSRLTGDPIYEEVALNALYSLFEHKSSIGLFGNHIDVQTGRWTAQDSGIGAGIDSYLEYLIKGSLMLNRPELMKMFLENRKPVEKYLKRDDWYIWVSMNKGQVTLPVFQSLEAYWPGLLSLIGDISSAMKTIHNYHTVWRQYGFLPEFYNIPNAEAGVNRENYPLRPELIESAMYLYRATGDPFLLQMGEDILRSIQHSAKTACGYATIKNVRDHNKENRMESFFLSETTKYLYLLFDPSNFLNNNGDYGVVINTPNGECIINTGGYIFNTEAHPIDPSILNCCHDMPRNNLLKDYDTKKYLGDLFDSNYFNDDKNDFILNSSEDESEKILNSNDGNNITIDTVADPEETRKNLVNEILNIINATKKSKRLNDKNMPETNDDSLILPINADKSTTVSPIDDNKLQIDSPVEIVKITTITERDPDSDKQKSKTNLIDETAAVILPPIVESATSIINENNLVNFNENNDDIEIINNTINNTKQKENNYYFSENDLNEDKHLQQQTIINKEIIDNNNNISNNTILTEFVQTILKTKYNSKKFDSQLLLEKIRLNNKENKLIHNFTVYSNDYKLLTCKAQPYLQRISVLGEFFNN